MKLLLDVVSLVAAVIGAVAQRVSRRPPPPVRYHDKHAWSDYDLEGNRVATHCVWCRQSRTVANRLCPGPDMLQ